MRLSISVHVHNGVSRDNPDDADIKIQSMWVELWGTCKNNVLGCIFQVPASTNGAQHSSLDHLRSICASYIACRFFRS